MLRIAAFLLALCLSVSAHAQIFGPAVYTPTVTGGGYTGPGDVVSGVAHFYGMEAVNTAYATPGTNPAFDYSCPGGSPATGTINILSTGFADAATLSSACGANTIDVTKIYDQVGTVNIDTIVAGNPTVALNCIGSHPCFVSGNGGSNCMVSSTTLSEGAPFSMVGSYQFPTNPTANQRAFSLEGGGTEAFLGGGTTPDMIGYHGTVLAASASVSAGTFYAVGAAFDSTGLVGVNGSTTSGTTGNASITGAKVSLGTDAFVSCQSGLSNKMLDMGVWSVSLSSTNMASISTQERANFGF